MKQAEVFEALCTTTSKSEAATLSSNSRDNFGSDQPLAGQLCFEFWELARLCVVFLSPSRLEEVNCSAQFKHPKHAVVRKRRGSSRCLHQACPDKTSVEQ